ncbi:MAG: helix-turn-helix domain-containing protein [Oscillospiraceae bacterium]|nr:helix-turn-helix domain-containing protein [Oscillospiraceae bacterium]
MTLPQKLETLIRRKGITKSQVADAVGITYRALANYIAGDRRPRPAILAKLAVLLESTPEFLLDDSRALVLTSAERFAHNATSPEAAVNAALALLADAKKVFGASELGELESADRQALFTCISEVYFAL